MEAQAPLRRIGPFALAAMASQALLVVLTPTIVDVGRDLGAPVEVVGQARSVTAIVAIATSLAITTFIDRRGVRPLLGFGAVVAVAACGAVAAAPSLTLFLAAHVLVGAAFACLLSGGFAGVAAFPRGERAWAMGQVVAANGLAWIVVNPVAGVLTEAFSWRAVQAVPAVIALAALATSRDAARRGGGEVAPGLPAGLRSVLSDPWARRWVVAELAAYFAWAGNLTFIGAFLIQRHDAAGTVAGMVLALGATAFLLAATRSGSLVKRLASRELTAVAALGTGTMIVVQFTVAPTVWVTAVLFCLVAVFAGVRTPAAGGLGLAQLPDRPGAMMSVRTAVVQLGYLLGALVGGTVLAVSGYAALGVVLGAGMILSAALVMRLRSAVPAAETATPVPGVSGDDRVG